MAELHRPHSGQGHTDRTGNSQVHHETSDVNIRGVLGFGAGLVVVAILVNLLVALVFQYFDARERRRQAIQYPLAVTGGTRLPPEPRLQTNPREDLRNLREQEDQLLTTYGWMDKNAGVARIPIDVAMKLTVERGLPVRKGQK